MHGAGQPGDSTTVDFDAVKRLFFGTAAERASLTAKPNALNAKALVFRYALMAHNLLGLGTTSGCGRSSATISSSPSEAGPRRRSARGRRPTSHGVGNVDQQSGTIAHEAGHTLGLRHGGGDNINCKSNYPSVMNYNHQFFNPTTRILDYSRALLFFLDKTNLVEADGVGPGFTGNIAFGPVAPLQKAKVAQAGGPIDWNVDTDTTDVLKLDLPQTTNAPGGCPANQIAPWQRSAGGSSKGSTTGCRPVRFRDSVDFAGGGHATSRRDGPHPGSPNLMPAGATPDITLETAAALTGDAPPLVVDVKKNNINPGSIENIEVTIFSAAGVDARTIVPETVRLQRFPPATWSVAGENKASRPVDAKDKNKDGRPDLAWSSTSLRAPSAPTRPPSTSPA